MKPTHLALLTAAALAGGSVQAALVGYWDFDSYTAEPNPTGTGLPQPGGDAGEGYFDDLSGHDQKAYGADFSGLNQVPFQAGAGRFGGAFYSENVGNNGALAVVKHTDAVNFNQESFTISFWEKSQFRDVAGSGWAAGRGRSQFFTKAPYLPNDPDNVILDGYGLNLTQNNFAFLTNKDGDNYGQDSLGAKYTFPTGTTPAYDSGTWAHWAITGQYNAGSDDYTMTIYLNGVAVDWDGATGTTFTVPNAIIDNPGDLTIGQFFRNNGWSAQRFISWNMTDGSAAQGNGKGWMDDFAMWDEVLSIQHISALAAGTVQPTAWISGPGTSPLAIAYDGGSNQLTFTWKTRSGKLYDLLSSTALDTPPSVWPVYDDGVTVTTDLAADPSGANTLVVAKPADAKRFFAVAEKDAPPPPPLLDADFEANDGGFTIAKTAGTDWALGTPNSTGPGGTVDSGNGAAAGAGQCWGTNIANPGFYADPTTNSCLRSPVIDLSAAAGAELSFAQALDFPPEDSAVVRIINADTDTEIVGGAFPLTVVDGNVVNNATWAASGPHALPVGARIRIEWCLSGSAGADNDYMGWYVDDVLVVETSP